MDKDVRQVDPEASEGHELEAVTEPILVILSFLDPKLMALSGSG